MPAANDIAVDIRVSNSSTSAAIRSSIRGSIPRSSRVLLDGPGDRGATDTALVQLGAQEVLPVDLHASQAEHPEEELAGELLRLRLLGLWQRVHDYRWIPHDIDVRVEDPPNGLRCLVFRHNCCSRSLGRGASPFWDT